MLVYLHVIEWLMIRLEHELHVTIVSSTLIRISFMLRHTAESNGGISSPPSLGVIITSLLLLCAGLKFNDHGRFKGKVSSYFCNGSSAKISFTTLNGNMDSRTGHSRVMLLHHRR